MSLLCSECEHNGKKCSKIVNHVDNELRTLINETEKMRSDSSLATEEKTQAVEAQISQLDQDFETLLQVEEGMEGNMECAKVNESIQNLEADTLKLIENAEAALIKIEQNIESLIEDKKSVQSRKERKEIKIKIKQIKSQRKELTKGLKQLVKDSIQKRVAKHTALSILKQVSLAALYIALLPVIPGLSVGFAAEKVAMFMLATSTVVK